MKENVHIMLDIETLGRRPGSVILSIGAVKIRENKIVDQFYRVLCEEEMEELGFEMEIDTLKWWAKQSPEAIAEVFENHDERHPQEVARDFAMFCSNFPNGENVIVWSKGAAFDLAHIEEFYRRLGDPVPFDHWNQRCFRTLRALHPQISPAVYHGLAHHALHDAVRQAYHMIQIFEHIEEQNRCAPVDLVITEVENHDDHSDVTLGVYEGDNAKKNPVVTIHHDKINGVPVIGDIVTVVPPQILAYGRGVVELKEESREP